MIHTLILWFVAFNILLLLWNRKGFFSMWTKILGLFGDLLKGVFNLTFSIIKQPFLLIGWLVKKMWWFITRLIHWVGWFILEFFKFIYNAIIALFTIFKA